MAKCKALTGSAAKGLMQRLASSWESTNTTILLQPYVTTSTGCGCDSVYLTRSAPWCTNACVYGRSSLSDRNVCSCHCQHWAPCSAYVQHHMMTWLYRAPGKLKYGPHSFFAVSDPSIWNSLPPAIRQSTKLRQKLKTFIFCSAYRTWLSARSRNCLRHYSSVPNQSINQHTTLTCAQKQTSSQLSLPHGTVN